VEATGTVSDETITVPAPALSGEYQLREVHPLGRITAGESLAVLEDPRSSAEAEASAADLEAANARIAALDAQAKEIDEAEAEAKKKRQTQQSSNTANTELRKQAEQLAELISKLQRCVAALKQQLADLPGTTAYTTIRKGVQRHISYFSGELTKAQAKYRQVKAKLDAADSTAGSGNTELTQAEKADFAKQREQVARLREAAVAAKEAAEQRQSSAADQPALTEVAAPVSGTIVQIGDPGQVIPGGAPLAVIRPDQPTQVTAWIPTGDHARLCLGAAATITGDWMAAGESVSGSIVSLGDAARYPPTSTRSDDIRPLRAIEITIEADTALPEGRPVGITLDPESSCHG
jgi:multidrug resistance efflux pump